jgi:sulfatase maturation enzyme AslB (radical SAM superfamily)
MSFETAKKFIDMLLDSETEEDNPYINIENSPGLIIEFIGGEPFLEIELMDQITDYFIS